MIESDSSVGAFVSTNTDDLSAVLATLGVNVILAEIEFDICTDAIGDLIFTLGRGTGFSDGTGFAVGHETYDLTIRVIPAPASIALLGLGGLATSSRRR
ncbi:MAG: PEP-CTERM sorting domain-containing protein [Planctomycetota bacterium]